MSRILALALIIVSFTVPAIHAQEELQDERILLTFIPNIQFAPFYVGIHDGHFARHGFNVTLEHLQEPEVLDLVAAGHANFGIVSGEQVILARAQARDVVYVFEWFQKYPVGLVVQGHNGLGISEIGELRGRKVGIPGRFGASYSGLTALLHSAGLTESDIELTEIGFHAPDVYCSKVVTAAVVYINNEPLQILNRSLAGECSDLGIPDVFPVADQVDLVSNGLIVHSDMLERESEKIQNMVSAFGQALKSAIENPARAYLASLSFVETLPNDVEFIEAMQQFSMEQAAFLEPLPSREDIAQSRLDLRRQLGQSFDFDILEQFDVLLNSIDLWDAKILGYSELGSWESMLTTLELMGFLDRSEQDLTASFSNQFIAGSSE